jgi:hypothetical protein
MMLPKTAHTSRPWRIHEFTDDFEVEDVWALPTPGGPDDLARLVQQFAATGSEKGGKLSVVVRTLFAVRWKLGALFGWDEPGSGVGTRVTSLRERLPEDLRDVPQRLPEDLRDVPRGPDPRAFPFTSVYQTKDEWVAESSNMTVHAVVHIGWVPDDADGYHAQMAVLVKPNGRLGKVYMAGIKPFRRTLVYPSLIRTIGRGWRRQTAG